jgi:alcohol dehydrogenase class IV
MSSPLIGARPADLTAWTDELDGTRVVFGAGALAGLGDAARDLGLHSVLLVTDSGMRAAGHVARATDALEAQAVRVAVFDEVTENPAVALVEAGRRAAIAASADGLVALGGGSALDCAKGINFLVTNGGRMEDYWGRDRATRPMLPSIGVPTTAGTGSEAQRFAIISQDESGTKMACGDVKARFRIAILDPELLRTAPPAVRATAAVDAASHAVESHVTRARTALSDLFSREAWRLIDGAVERYLGDPGDASAGAAMLLGSYLGGAAIEHSMLGAAHACANPLTSRRHVTHGLAVGIMLPHVVRYNAADLPERYDALGAGSAERLIDRLGRIQRAAGLATRLRDCGVLEADLDDLAHDASRQWTAGFNPRPVDGTALRELYAAAI